MKTINLMAKVAGYAISALFVCQLALPATAQTLESVTNAANGNYTTKNIWIGTAPIAGVTENALNIHGGGKIKFLGAANAYTPSTDANQPTIYRSGFNTGDYPFNNYDHLILQAGIQNRDILLVTGSTPTPRLVVTGAGNVGIGTTTPGTYKLAVEGTIGARRVKVTQSAWADFVFHPDYQLPSLLEVEKYIKANRHLPEIPSASEVEKDGLDVGEMNKKLLQKVEELTLYLIDIKKEINQLKEQNELLNKRINTSAQK